MKRTSLTALAAAAALAASLPAHAIDATWLGGNGSWSDAHWSTGNFPTSGLYRAVVDSQGIGSAFVTGNVNATAAGLVIGGTDTLAFAFGNRLTLFGDVLIKRTPTTQGRLVLTLGGKIELAAPVTFSGGGRTEFGNSDDNVILSSAGNLMTIASDHTVRGGGRLGSSTYGYLAGGLLNQGLILADGAMGIDTGGAGFRNTGTVRVVNNLSMSAITDNSGGAIEVLAGGSLSMGGQVNGGTLRGFGASYIRGGRIGNLTLAGELHVHPGDRLDATGTLNNTGTLAIAAYAFGSSSGRAQLHFSGGASTLAGSGQTVLVDGYTGVISSDSDSPLTVAAGHTLRGSGYLGASFVAYLNGGLLNRGVIAAESGRGILIDTGGGAFDNTGGLVSVADGSVLHLAGGTTMSGGVLAGSGSARIEGSFRDLAFEGPLTVTRLVPVTLAGTIDNRGTLTVLSTGFYFVDVRVGSGGLVLAGSGQTVITDNDLNVFSSAPGDPLTIAAGHTLRGGGSLGSAAFAYLSGGLRNDGTLIVDANGGMGIDTAGALFRNGATVNVVRGELRLAAPTDNSGGLFDLAANTRLRVAGELAGGTLRGAAGSLLYGGVVRDLRIEGVMTVPLGQTLTLGGTIVNVGELHLEGASFGTGNVAAVRLAGGPVTLAGSGQTVLDAGSGARVIYGDSASRLVIGPGHTLRGGGSLGAGGVGYLQGGLLNEGTLRAERNIGIDTAGAEVINRGLLRVDAGADLLVAGVVLEQDGASAVLDVRGRLIAPFGVLASAGLVQGTGRIDGALDASGATLAPGASVGRLTLAGPLTLGTSSRLAIEADGLQRGTGYDWLDVFGSVLVDGALDIDIGYAAQLGDSFEFLTGAAVSGQFDTVTSAGYVLGIEYAGTFVRATVVAISPVPEPQAWLLLPAGLIAIGWRSRRLSKGN